MTPANPSAVLVQRVVLTPTALKTFSDILQAMSPSVARRAGPSADSTCSRARSMLTVAPHPATEVNEANSPPLTECDAGPARALSGM